MKWVIIDGIKIKRRMVSIGGKLKSREICEQVIRENSDLKISESNRAKSTQSSGLKGIKFSLKNVDMYIFEFYYNFIGNEIENNSERQSHALFCRKCNHSLIRKSTHNIYPK